MLDRTNDAIDTYTSLQETPLSYMANNNLSLIMLELGEFEKCIKYAQESLKDNNNYNDAKYNLAVGLFERKEYIKSLDICQILLTLTLSEISYYLPYKTTAFPEVKCRYL